MVTMILGSIGAVMKVMGWIGLALFFLVMVNTVGSTLYNISEKQEEFSWRKMLKGLSKFGLFYICAILVAMSFTILPYINEMINDTFGHILIDNETLETISGLGVFAICVSILLEEGKKAMEGLKKFGNIKADVEEITWEVIEDEEELEEEV